MVDAVTVLTDVRSMTITSEPGPPGHVRLIFTKPGEAPFTVLMTAADLDDVIEQLEQLQSRIWTR